MSFLHIETIVFLFFLVPQLLSADIASSSISSTKAFYDGNALILQGNVELNHNLGTMQAGAARLEKEEQDLPFSIIHLKEDVLIMLKNQGQIRCGYADFDFNAMSGQLLPKMGETICFSKAFLTTGEKRSPLSLTSHRAEIALIKESEQLQILEIVAKDDVMIHYGDGFTLTADRAVYSQDKGPNHQPRIDASANCHLTHSEDWIDAKQVEFYPQESKIVLSYPKGNLKTSVFSTQEEIAFSCQKLLWDEPLHLLTLSGDVVIHEKELGEIQCAQQIQLKQKHVDGKWMLCAITTQGKTQLKYQFNEGPEHTLTCWGPLCLDQEKLMLTLDSPGPEGKKQQIEYFHEEMKLYADHAQMHYARQDDKLQPKTLFFEGNVHLSRSNQLAGARCAIADKFSYFPQTQTLILSANEGRKVLFWDDEQDLSISAHEVHITRTAKQDAVKGIGNVHFAFSSKENALLKKLFPFYQPPGGSDEPSR